MCGDQSSGCFPQLLSTLCFEPGFSLSQTASARCPCPRLPSTTAPRLSHSTLLTEPGTLMRTGPCWLGSTGWPGSPGDPPVAFPNNKTGSTSMRHHACFSIGLGTGPGLRANVASTMDWTISLALVYTHRPRCKDRPDYHGPTISHQPPSPQGTSGREKLQA